MEKSEKEKKLGNVADNFIYYNKTVLKSGLFIFTFLTEIINTEQSS